MEITTQGFFLFNFLIALWVIASPFLGKGKQAKPLAKISLVFIGIAYLGIVGTAYTQLESSKSAYLGMTDEHSVEQLI